MKKMSKENVVKTIIDYNVDYDHIIDSFYEKGDFKKVIKYKNKAIDCAPYSLEEYTDFCEKLLVGVSLYENVNDKQSARVCKRELIDISDRLAETKEKTSSLAWKIQNKPELDLPEEYAEIIEEYENSGEF
jgi:tetratricopeptide (TPR) repeat protein